MFKLNHTDNGNGQMAIINDKLQCVAFVPKFLPDFEKYVKLFESSPDILEALKHTLEILYECDPPKHLWETYANAFANYNNLVRDCEFSDAKDENFDKPLKDVGL